MSARRPPRSRTDRRREERGEEPPAGVSREAVLAHLRDAAARPLSAEELARALGAVGRAERRLRRLLEELEREGAVVRTRLGRYGLPARMNLVVGTLQGHERGYAFVVPMEGGPDLFVPAGATGDALHGDRVVARLTGGRATPRGRRPAGGVAGGERRQEAEVIRVLRRANGHIVGTLERKRGFALVTPDERRIPYVVVVPGPHVGGAGTGDKVLVEITAWPAGRRAMEGRVVRRLGRADEPGMDVLSVILRQELPLEFPARVLREAEERARVGAEGRRRDLRHLVIFTVDGEDARDLDDALSVERPGDGRAAWRLGVHVADVSHYVQPGTALDAEARDRATSVYLVDRVLPMLPPVLSNGVCSLDAGVDRLAVSVFLDLDRDGKVLAGRVFRSVIRSRARLTYTAVWELLRGAAETAADLARFPAVRLAAEGEETALLPVLVREAGAVAAALRARRMRRGSVDFDLPEAKVLLDEAGRPVVVAREERTRAHLLIEDCMIAANEAVARLCLERRIPCLYRVHEPPDPEEAREVAALLFELGVPFKVGAEPRPLAWQRAVAAARGRPEEVLVNAALLRSLKRARYAAENLGHFGLASGAYCHFTSPIRRYPDLMVHRLVKFALTAGGATEEALTRLAGDLRELAAHCSERERRAEEAEEESVRVKMAAFMKERLGEEWPALVTGVTNFGLFVQLPNLVEGLVHVSTLTDDYYRTDERGIALVGERTGRRFRLGDPVRVRVAGADPLKGTVDFVLAGH